MSRDLFIVLAVSLLLSWILALVHVPLMADRWLKQPAGAARGERLYDGRIYGWLRSALGFGLRHRISSILLALGLVALSAWGYGFMRQGFFPRHGLRPALHGVQTPRRNELDPRGRRPARNRDVAKKPAPRSAR